MQKLKEALFSPPVLRPLRYDGRTIIVSVDSTPDATRWALGQDDEEGRRFGAKIFSTRQRHYPQIKQKLWGGITLR